MSANPRRAVIESKHLHGHTWSNRFVCKLSCGHTQHANGRYVRVAVGSVPTAPMTVGCSRCARALDVKEPTHG